MPVPDRRIGKARASRPHGFTLVEVVTALAIGGAAVLLAAAMLKVLSDQAELVSETARRDDKTGSSERILRRLIGQMTYSAENEPASRGTVTVLRFTSACDVPVGWQERCVVELRVRETSDSGATTGVDAVLSTGERLLLLPSSPVLGFTYLQSSTLGGRWRSTWVDGSALPPAIGVVLPTDTLIIRTGERG